MNINSIKESENNLIEIPYKGLNSYLEKDAEFFFGRDLECEILIDNLMANKLTLLYGPSGVGKSSILQAGVAHRINKLAKRNIKRYGIPEVAILVFNDWKYDPLACLIKQITCLIKQINSSVSTQSYSEEVSQLQEFDDLQDALNLATDYLGDRENKEKGEFYIILDQFEEFFLYRSINTNHAMFEDFAVQFSKVVNSPALPVNFIVSLRDDCLAKLDYFKVNIPTIFECFIRIDHLDIQSAQEAITKPILIRNKLITNNKEFNKEKVNIEKGLSELVIEKLTESASYNENLALKSESSFKFENRVQAPYIQLVMSTLWKKEVQVLKSSSLTVKTFMNIGGAKSIIKQYFFRQLESLKKQKGAWILAATSKLFYYLITPSGTKIAYPENDLIENLKTDTGLTEKKIRDLITSFSSNKIRILRPIESPSHVDFCYYEIYHDLLTHPILEWQSKYSLEEKKNQKNQAIKQGLPAQSLRQLRLGRIERAALLARQAYLFYLEDPENVFDQVDDALRSSVFSTEFNCSLLGHESSTLGISQVVFHPKDPEFLASADHDGNILLWNLKRLPNIKQYQHIIKIPGGISALEFSPDGSKLVFGGSDNKIHLWDFDSTIVKNLNIDLSNVRKIIVGEHNDKVTSLSFNLTGNILASCSLDKTIKLWKFDTDFSSYSEVTLIGHKMSVKSVDFCPNKKHQFLLASSSDDKTVKLWNVNRKPEESLIKTLDENTKSVKSIHFSPNGQLLASGSEDGNVRVWDLTEFNEKAPVVEELDVLSGHNSGVKSVCFSPDGKWLASGSKDQTIYLWQVSQANKSLTTKTENSININLYKKLRGHHFGISTVSFSSDIQLLASGSWDKTIRLWKLSKSESMAALLTEIGTPTLSVSSSSDGRWLATGDQNCKVILWDLNASSDKLFEYRSFEHQDKVLSVSFSHNSKWLASASADKTIALIDLQNPENKPIILRGHTDIVTSVVFSPDNRWLASGGRHTETNHNTDREEDRSVRLWNLNSLENNAPILGKVLWKHDKTVNCVAFSPDGSMLASCSDDHTIKFLDLSKNTLTSWDSIYSEAKFDSFDEYSIKILTLNAHSEEVLSIAFSPNSESLASASKDRSIKIWTLLSTDSDNINDKPKLLEGHNFWVSSVRFSPDGSKLVSASYDKTIRIWNTNKLNLDPIVLRGHKQSITQVCFTFDGKQLISSSYDGTIQSWILDTSFIADMVCQNVYRNLTKREWDWFMGSEIPYQCTCDNLPPSIGIETNKQENVEDPIEGEFNEKIDFLGNSKKYIFKFNHHRKPSISVEEASKILQLPKIYCSIFLRALLALGFLKTSDVDSESEDIRYNLTPQFVKYLSRMSSDPKNE